MLTNKNQWCQTLPKEYSSPIEGGDHSELDLLPELDQDGIQIYQSFIGELQWAVTLGRFDILVGTTTMFSFCVAPHQRLFQLLKIYVWISPTPKW
jgi:hypothetical protein